MMTISELLNQDRSLHQLWCDEVITGPEYADLRKQLVRTICGSVVTMIDGHEDRTADCLSGGLKVYRRYAGSQHPITAYDLLDELKRMQDEGIVVPREPRVEAEMNPLTSDDLLHAGQTLDDMLDAGAIEQSTYDRVRADFIFQQAMCFAKGVTEQVGPQRLLLIACINLFRQHVGDRNPMNRAEFARDLAIIDRQALAAFDALCDQVQANLAMATALAAALRT